ncbi:DOMON-like domain-containing protein [Sphingosinicella sp. BN140058]|uniref:DOMON-like domain-containing protein n=1 Tax=Sphingosinicella sp. BN140058 TaxID=1892855 RepID=UPI0010104CDA|nr:DOMON-like domain-containing protein [Sphingosinicella sp. BN140058]QAY79353.1 DOMON-like domain-containing protein [Sphingosinicella sp. BN140058]
MPLSLPLVCHPASPCGALRGIEVELTRLGGRRGARRLALRYVANGNLRALEAPFHVTHKDRADELWRHTCFEAFVRIGDSVDYFEFNFAPDGQWNAYHFEDYRTGMTREAAVDPPGIGSYIRDVPLAPQHKAGLEAAGVDPFDRFDTPFFMLTATADLERTRLPIDQPWHVGLSAIIEERNGTRSYWALRHPPGEPDFHHPDCFQLELPPARPA